MKIKKPMKKVYRGGDIITYPNGDVYDGDLEDGNKEGEGEMKYANGDFYRGDWANDRKDGEGQMEYANGDSYDGEWSNDKKEGDGVFMYSPGQQYRQYRGDFENDIKEGSGIMEYSDGSHYEGEWLNDLRHGEGVFITDTEEQSGLWEEDTFLGETRPIAQVLNAQDEAYQIHRASAKINLDKYLQIINVNTGSNYGNITDYVRSKFVPLITRLFSNIPIEEDRISPKDQAIVELNRILERLNSADYSNEPKNINIIGKTVDFVLKQPDEFIEFYINAFIQDCYNAYQDGQMSCVAGIVERFYMIIGDAAYAMCPDENCNNQTYIELLTLFGKKIDKNELTQEWAEKYLESDEIKNMSKSERKQHYINFMKSKYNDLDMLDETTEKLINIEADNLDYVFESLQFGGKKRNKQTRKNRNRGKKLTKKRLGKSKFRVRTIKVKKGKRRVSRKRSNKKIERISKRS